MKKFLVGAYPRPGRIFVTATAHESVMHVAKLLPTPCEPLALHEAQQKRGIVHQCIAGCCGETIERCKPPRDIARMACRLAGCTFKA